MSSLSACVVLLLLSLHISTAAIPNFDFFGDKECDPVQQLLQDPRANGLNDILRTYKLLTFFKSTWDAKGGTIVIPTTDAFDGLLDDIGVSLANVTTAIANATWVAVLPSYFLSNTSYLPKDVYNNVYQTSGDFFLYTSLLGNASTASILLRYVDITSSVIRSGAQPLANVAPYGKPAVVTDFSLVCDQYVVYWLDEVLMPVTNTCALTRAGCGNATLSSVVNALKATG